MRKRSILVVEDDTAIRDGVVDALNFDGYHVFEAPRGDKGLDMALRLSIDLLLVDLVLPGCSGIEIVEQVRRSRPVLPIIILTAKGAEADRVKGLRIGADDYVVKPFSVKELLARVQAVLRRSPERPSDLAALTIPGGQADFLRCEVRFDDGRVLCLSEKERELLRYLATNPGRAISREELLSHVWRINPQGLSTRTVDMHVARLREKLECDRKNPQVVVTVRGKGYMLAANAST